MGQTATASWRGAARQRHKSATYMYFVYILRSIKLCRYYIGHAHDINIRLARHNKGLVRSTKFGAPWEIVHIETFKTKQEAYRRELQIKSYKGGDAFKKLVGEN
jgi:putative endonuclease